MDPRRLDGLVLELLTLYPMWWWWAEAQRWRRPPWLHLHLLGRHQARLSMATGAAGSSSILTDASPFQLSCVSGMGRRAIERAENVVKVGDFSGGVKAVEGDRGCALL
jgi:hypothetical protein